MNGAGSIRLRDPLPLLLFVLFVGVPILEIAAFIKIGGWIGVLPTLLGCVVTAVIGAFLVRLQGFGVLRNAQAAIARHEIPVDEIAHGVFILIAGVLLMTPGYVTDAMGFLLLIPPLRLKMAHAAIAYLKDRARKCESCVRRPGALLRGKTQPASPSKAKRSRLLTTISADARAP